MRPSSSHAYHAGCRLDLTRALGCVRLDARKSIHGVRRSRRYEFFNCQQLCTQRVAVKTREQKLKQLMERAERGTGGAFVNVIAYKGDYVAATEELQVIDMTLRVKKCSTPENWGSNSEVR